MRDRENGTYLAMTPSAEPTSRQADLSTYLVPADLMGEGEIIIMAIKPSGWFVLVASFPVLISALMVAVIAYVMDFYRSETPKDTIVCLCAAFAMVRVLWACWQWAGRTYVLTNYRVVTVRGLVHPKVSSAALEEIHRAEMTETVPEKLCGTGSIYCLSESQCVAEVVWNTVDNPNRVHETVQKAIKRAR